MGSAVLFLLLLACPQAHSNNAPSPVSGVEVANEETEVARRLSGALRQDPALRQSLVQRILQSSLAKKFSAEPDRAAMEVEDWILRDPDGAAQLKIGFAKDDLYGTHDYEKSLYVRIIRYFELNPKREQGILGVLETAGSQSRFMLQHGKKLDEEEQRDLIKRIFEGGGPGGRQNATLPGNQSPPSLVEHPPGALGPAVFAGSIYDRLNTANLAGYSPDVLALQNSLNIQRVPGAPRIPETGRLNYETLAFPYYLLRYDLERLDGSFQTGWSQDRPPSFRTEEGKKALRLAAQALEKLQLETTKSKNPSQITRSLLEALGQRQKETARWITVASLESDIEHLNAASDHWPGDLQEKISVASTDEAARQRYVEEGKRLLDRVTRVKEADARVIENLRSRDFLSHWENDQGLLAQAAPLRNNLSLNIAIYLRMPYLFPVTLRVKPWWRVMLDRCVSYLFPNSNYGRRLRREDKRRTFFQAAFEQIASGDYAGAQDSLTKAQVL